MALTYHTTMFFTFTSDDLPLSTDYIESTRALNLSVSLSDPASKITFTDGAWATGWDTYYEDAGDAPAPPIPSTPVPIVAGDLEGLPTNRSGMAGWHLALDDNLNSWDLVPVTGTAEDPPEAPEVLDVTEQGELIQGCNSTLTRLLPKGDSINIVNDSFISLGNNRKLIVEMMFTRISDSAVVNARIAYLKTDQAGTSYDWSAEIMGDSQYRKITIQLLNGSFGVQITGITEAHTIDVYVVEAIS